MTKNDGLLEGIDDDPAPDRATTRAIRCVLLFEAAALAVLLGVALTWMRPG
jgi:hypothetical protein